MAARRAQPMQQRTRRNVDRLRQLANAKRRRAIVV
jgi:hypothetical protein